jgi:hypothetical protein
MLRCSIMASCTASRAVNLFSVFTQDFRPGLLSVAPAGAMSCPAHKRQGTSAAVILFRGRGRPRHVGDGQHPRTGVSAPHGL